MTELLTRLRGYFLEIDESRPDAPPVRRRRVLPEAVGLIGPPRLAVATGAALALTLARLQRSRCALVCRFADSASGMPPVADHPVLGEGASPVQARRVGARGEMTASGASAGQAGGAPATLAARRAAAALRARDIAADAAGRLVRVALEEDTNLAAPTVAQAAAVVSAPVVLAIDRPRDEGVDRALAQQDAIGWVAPEGADASLVALVVPSLEALGPPAFPLRPPGALARRLALSGVAAPGLAASLVAELDGAAA